MLSSLELRVVVYIYTYTLAYALTMINWLGLSYTREKQRKEFHIV